LEATDAVAEAGLEGGRDMIGERRRSLGKRDDEGEGPGWEEVQRGARLWIEWSSE
jgi:hypothetical protein